MHKYENKNGDLFAILFLYSNLGNFVFNPNIDAETDYKYFTVGT